MSESTPIRQNEPKPAPLSNWPRYPGGVVGGIVLAIASVLLFLIDTPALHHFLPAVRIVVVVLWALRLFRSDD